MVNCFYVLLILFISCIFDYCTVVASEFREGVITNPLRITTIRYKEPIFSALVQKEYLQESRNWTRRKSDQNIVVLSQETMDDNQEVGVLEHEFNACLATSCGGFIGTASYLKDNSKDSCFSECKSWVAPCVCVRDCFSGLVFGPSWVVFGLCTNEDKRKTLSKVVHSAPTEVDFFTLMFLNLCCPCCSCC